MSLNWPSVVSRRTTRRRYPLCETQRHLWLAGPANLRWPRAAHSEDVQRLDRGLTFAARQVSRMPSRQALNAEILRITGVCHGGVLCLPCSSAALIAL